MHLAHAVASALAQALALPLALALIITLAVAPSVALVMHLTLDVAPAQAHALSLILALAVALALGSVCGFGLLHLRRTLRQRVLLSTPVHLSDPLCLTSHARLYATSCASPHINPVRLSLH